MLAESKLAPPFPWIPNLLKKGLIKQNGLPLRTLKGFAHSLINSWAHETNQLII
jgi:hypothetical protein